MGRWLVFVVVLLWSGVAGASVTMTPSTVAVGNVVVNTSANNTGTLSGTAAEHVDLVIGACSGAGAGTFVLTPNVNVNLTSAKTITVSYTPTARGARSCTVNVYDTGTTTTLTTFTITGTGVAPVVSPAPTSLSLGVVRYNDAAATHTSTQNLVISNVGDAGQTLTVSSVTSNNPDYTIIPPGSNTINSGGSGTWVVTFNPSMPGADNAVLTIASNDPVTPMKTVNATGTGGTAVIGVTATLNFGIINNGTASTTQNIVVSNNGAGSKGPMAVTQATFVNNTAGWFKFTQAGCVGSTTTCALAYSLTSTTGTVGVQCAPPANAMGTQTAQVTISSDADDTTMSTTSLMCTAGRADLVAPTTPLSFANQPINTTSAMQPVMIQNTGNATLTYGLAMAGTDASQFVITGASGCTSNCTVSANSSVMVNVAFRPTSTGSKNATFRITPTNDPDTVNVDVPVSGTGIAPIASLNVTSMTFGNVDVGTTATAQTLTVTNTGTADLLISAATMFSGAADYVVPTGTTGSGLSINVAPNMSVSWTIACKPTTFASRPGTFRITSNTNNAPGTNSDVALTCTGLQGILTASPTSYDFMAVNQGNMVTHDFTITNTGNTTVTNIASALSGTGVGYSVVTGTIAALAGGASTTVTVQFYPMTGSDGGPKTVTFSGSWGTAGTASAPITLNGDGLTTGFDTYPSPPNAKDFGDLRFDATATGPVNVINTAGTTYHINTLTITPGTAQTGEFTILSCTHNSTAVTCPTMAQPFTSTGINDTLVLSVRCDPNNRVAMLDATLTVTTDLPTNPSRVVPLKCNSVTAGLEVDPATNVLDFGATDLDAPTVAVTRTINLKNTGTATLNLSAATKSGAGLALYTFSATPATAVAPNATFPIDVTYTPLTEKPSNQPDVASIMIPVTGVYGGPNSITIQISGYGADRHIAVAPAPVFPPTFRNPGDAAPIMPVTITNNGDFPLAISAVMLSDDPVWTLVNPDPVTIPGRGTYDFNVKFSPVTAGKAPTGHLMIMDDDNARPSVAFDFDGTGLDRNVSINPTVIDFGYAPIGGEVKLSEVSPTTPLAVTNMETAAPIMIHSIQIDGEGFTVFDPKTSASPNDFPLDPGTTKGFDVTFSPDRGGTFEATATLYLDMDPSPQATIQLRGHAATVDVHGGGGCSAGHDLGGGALILIAVVLVLRRRRGAATARAAAVVLVVGATATSRADDIDSETFRPTPAIGAFAFQLEPAGVGKEGEWAASALMSFASNSVAVQAMDSGSVVSDERPVTRRTGLELGGAYAFLDRFEAGVRVPLYSQQGESDSMTTFHIPAAKGASLGDIAIHARAQLAEKSGLVAGAGLHL
ncbi:MAG TPA: choice-of-anchor D domain-containing protein, partial [Kofleriaceae bacterium]|nr:choice-of-anchor D domain-containing protein [Kofleriaceae bacterium]